MTEVVVVPRLVVVGNGSLGPYTLSVSGTAIDYASSSELVLKRYTSAGVLSATLVLGVDFTLSASSVTSGGTAATFTLIGSQAVLASNEKIVVERVTAKTSDFSLASTGNVFALAIDKITRILQELFASIGRSGSFHPLYTGSTEMPAASAGAFLGWAGDGLSITNLEGVADVAISSAMTPAVQAATTDAGLDALNGVMEVATKAALAALTGGVPDAVYVHGRSSANDGYGGLFVWSSSNFASTVTIDTTGALVVAPNSDTTGASGVWRRIYDGPVNLKWFGAAGDNSTNDTTAVQAWIDACRNFTKTGFAPNGQYKCDALTYGALTQANTVCLFGTGPDTCRIIKRTNDANALITFNSSGATTYLTGIIISGISFEGLSSGTTVKHYSMVRAVFRDCAFSGGANGVEQLGGIGVVYDNCAITGNTVGLKIRKYSASIGSGYPNLTTVRGGSITSNTTSNIDFDDGKHLQLNMVDVEGAVTNIVVGSSIGSEDSAESIGVIMIGGWLEAATGTAAAICASGLNIFSGVYVAANSSTYDFSFTGGRYVLRDITGSTSKTTSVNEGGSIGSPNLIDMVKLGGAFAIDSAKTFLRAGPALGYATGAGGAVTQSTDKTTGVTLNKICGAITTNNATLNAGVEVSFTLTNSTIAATDVVVASIKSGATAGAYALTVDAVAAGSCRISLSNQSAGNLGEAIVINFAVVKAVAS